MKKLVVFDLDGTLNRTDLYSVPAHLRALKERGIYNITADEIVATYGERAQDYVKKLTGLDDPVLSRRYLDDVAKYEKELIYTVGRPYEGIMSSLQKLKRAGYLTAICSNSSVRYITMVLDALGLSEWIDEIQELRPQMTKVQTLRLLLDRIQPSAAVMVGDRCFDIEAGKENGLPTIGCVYGFNPEEARSADIAVESAEDIFGAVDRLIGHS